MSTAPVSHGRWKQVLVKTWARLCAWGRSSQGQRAFWAALGLLCWALAAAMVYRTWFCQQTDATWQQLQRDGLLRVCMDATYPPFAVQAADGTFSGYDVDLIGELAGRWGVQVQWINVHFDGLYDALLTDKCQLLASALPYDETLTEDVLYSPSYFNAGLLLVVREDERRISGVNGLGGHAVGVQLGSNGHLEARRLVTQARIPLQSVPFESAQQALQALRDGQVDAVIADSVSVYSFAHQQGGIRYGKRFLTDEQYVLAMRPESGYLWKRIADGLAQLKREGFLQELQARWF